MHISAQEKAFDNMSADQLTQLLHDGIQSGNGSLVYSTMRALGHQHAEEAAYRQLTSESELPLRSEVTEALVSTLARTPVVRDNRLSLLGDCILIASCDAENHERTERRDTFSLQKDFYELATAIDGKQAAGPADHDSNLIAETLTGDWSYRMELYRHAARRVTSGPITPDVRLPLDPRDPANYIGHRKGGWYDQSLPT